MKRSTRYISDMPANSWCLTRPGALALAALFAALAAVILLAPLVPAPGTLAGFRVRAYGTHVVWFALVLGVVSLLARGWSMPRRRIAVLLVALGAAVVLANALELYRPADPAKVAFAALAGAAFVRAIERPWWLLPICVLVPVADAWSVYSERGVTNEVVERAAADPSWILWPTIATPIAGYDYAGFGRLGIVDVLFAGLFVAAAVRWGWHVWRGAAALLAGLLVTSALVFESSDIAIPALPMLCLGCLAAYAPQLVRDARAAWRERPGSGPGSSGSFTE